VGGGEHIVRLDEKADRVFKATQLVLTHTEPPRPNTWTGSTCKTSFSTMTSGWSGW
jgi:hypothetical protein